MNEAFLDISPITGIPVRIRFWRAAVSLSFFFLQEADSFQQVLVHWDVCFCLRWQTADLGLSWTVCRLVTNGNEMPTPWESDKNWEHSFLSFYDS